MRKVIEELKKDFDRWKHIKINRANDPFHPDGINMNLVRNHIIANKRRIKEICEREGLDYPEIYHKETPPEADNRYMANKDEIRTDAHKALDAYKSNKYFKELERVCSQINDKNKRGRAENVLRYKTGLEQAIKEDNLVAMRRHRNYENYTESAKEIIESLDTVDLKGQITMF